ncbi:hypothetical protein P7H60_03425 [Vagococcus carniphilus]|uniref:Uncharacterized protein n=1 Tax=Vagococcus carniphilus TaxID=218144 RepID=A0AAW8U7W8_9ENTE|nr:hypothetical protein [Vagococcus carniphilus]MDT2813357.1 hypothetical protein [Vagococcus carniphilus]MDT2830189.1 hypothetical protein [Vagococcus carniphilus]MDT2833874.1 hypothetical protein [Vagococcus carniphilus]MDT2838621.1 hypothetical protein [Vagococcus carniphilus]MDT2848222.1 hypothetical protein [Vagococcus carniphilus]
MVSSNRSVDSESENSVKKFTRFISRSSQRFFASFIDEESEKEKQSNRIRQQINQAITQKSIVVIQYRDDLQEKAANRFETLVGRIYQHATNPDSLVIKLQKDNQVRMISAKNIKKISIIRNNPNLK